MAGLDYLWDQYNTASEAVGEQSWWRGISDRRSLLRWGGPPLVIEKIKKMDEEYDVSWSRVVTISR